MSALNLAGVSSCEDLAALSAEDVNDLQDNSDGILKLLRMSHCQFVLAFVAHPHDASRGKFSLLLPDQLSNGNFGECRIKRMSAKDPIVPFGIPVKTANDLKAS